MATIRNKATLDSKPFTQGVGKMEAKVKGFGNSLGNVKRNLAGAFSTGMVASFANKALQAADNVDNLSKQLGLSVETTQSLKIAFDEAGLGVEGLATIMSTLQQKQAEAVTGSESAQEAFAALGISMEQLENSNPEKLLEIVSMKLGDVEGDAAAADAMFEVMGARSLKMKNALQEAAQNGFGALNDAMIQSGRIMEEDVIKKLDTLEERFARQKQRIEAESATLLSKGISAIEELAGMAGAISAGGTAAEGIKAIREQYGELDKIQELEAERDAERKKRNLLRASLGVSTLGISELFLSKPGKAEKQLENQIKEQKKTNQLLQEAVNKENKAVL